VINLITAKTLGLELPGSQPKTIAIVRPYRKSNPDVLMAQSASDRQAENAANGLNTNGPGVARTIVLPRIVLVPAVEHYTHPYGDPAARKPGDELHEKAIKECLAQRG
jgi:hypothetical protein